MTVAVEKSFVEAMLTDVPPAFWVGAFFVIGSFVGSFLNVVIYRLPRNCLSVNNPKRSFCPSCKTQLKVRDNIPIFGWALLRGKCRYCGAKFRIRYALVELLTAMLFAYAAWRVLFVDVEAVLLPARWLTLAHILLMVCVLIPWALIDLDLQTIPDSLTFVPLIAFIALSANADAYTWNLPQDTGSPRLTYDPLVFDMLPDVVNSMTSALATGIAAMAFLFLAGRLGNLLFRKQAQKIGGDSMGWADVKIMLLLGVMLGWPKMIAGFFIAIALGACVGIVARLAKGSLGVPFGPFLAIGAIIATLFARDLGDAVKWYFDFLRGLGGE